MKSRFAVVITMFLTVFVMINFYVGWHGQFLMKEWFPLAPLGLYWSVFWLIAFSYILSRVGSRYLPELLTRLLKVIGSYWLGVMWYLFLLLPFADIAAWIAALSSVAKGNYVPVIALSVALLLALLLSRGLWNATHPIVRKYEITVLKHAGPLKELRVAVASDIHLGTVVGTKKLQTLVDKVNALNPDLILFPGDIIDDDINPFIRSKMGDIMKRLRSKYGTFAVLGNHEYISGHVKEFTEQMKLAGITVLLDNSVLVAEQHVYLIGRKDRAAIGFSKDGRLGLDALLDGVDKSKPLILMDHQPYHLDKAAAAGIDVMLSGHTHRGQMAPNHLITRRLFELDWGYLQKGALHAIVSSGYGTWGPPIRLGSRSELIELVIRFEKSVNITD
jgi:predicted MPP superfamily phosphohydrolase